MIRKGLSAVLVFTILFSLFTFGSGVSLAAGPNQPGVTTTTNSASLTWTNVQGADSYNVYRSLSSNGAFTKVNSTGIVVTNYTDTGLTGNTRYYYKVSSVSGGNESGLSVEVSGLTQPDFGPNVFIFDPLADPAQPAVNVQAKSDELFAQQETNQFGTQRYAMLFKPGAYNVNMKVGFYTQVSGLGQVPDDVTINGGVTVDANWLANHNATQNFWRSVENLAVAPTNRIMKFAVSQAAPIRRLHVKGDLTLHDQGGWASGGYLADTLVDGTVNSGSQQQWFTRNSQWGSWNGSLWNTTIVGSVNAPAEDWPTKAFTIVDKSPINREKPFLTFDSVANQYKVFVPDAVSNKSGTSWSTGSTPGTSIPIENFLIADPTTSVTTINAALDQGKNLLFTPGVYHFTDTVKITQPNTVVLGLGLATLHSDNGIVALSVADVDGVKIAGLLFEAGSVNSPVLLQVGPKGSSIDHSANPTSLHDLYFRVGGDALAKADVCIEINSNNVIGDHFWVWRADHGTGAGWNSNTTINGMIVNGNDVNMYGLFVEHFHQYQTLWNGERGRTYFYQTEIPYDVPNQESWMSNSGTVNGYASYKVADTVTSHEAYGLGIYSNFTGGIVSMESGIEIPDAPGVKIHNATTVSLNKVGEITHVANAMGSAVNTGTMRTTIGDYMPRTVTSLTDVNAATIAGKAPVLPAVVTEVFTDSTTKKAAVTWDSIDPSKYAAAGSFVVNGTIIGTLIKAVANVTVAAAPNMPVTGIQISGAGDAKAVTVKGTLQMSAVVTPANADNGAITWSVLSTNGTATSLATISSTGLLTAVKEGTVKVIATANDGTGVTASQFITISSIKVASITVTGQNSVTAATYKGASLQMLADVQPLNATDRTYTWSVVNGSGTATIDSSGMLKALSDGTVNVIATAKDGSGITGKQTITISGQTLILGNNWSWVRENRDNWAINPTNPNVLRLNTIEGSWGGTKPSNILLRDPGAASNFTITTKLNFDATASFEWAGLIIYQDDGNLISLGRQANGSPAVKQIRFSQVKAGTQTDKNYTDPVAPGDIYLKIDKTGTTYKGYYSSDGATWTQVTDTFTQSLTSPQIGIFDRKLNTSIPSKPAEFSDFKFSGTVIPYWIPVNSVSVSGENGLTSITTQFGTLQLSAQLLPLNASSNAVIWSVYNSDGSPTDKATINSNGLLTAVKNGQVKVVATAYDGSGIRGSALFDITGQPIAVTAINVTGANGVASITTKGSTLQMSAAVLPANATVQTVTWSVYNLDGSPTDKATISISGLLTSVKNGQVKVVAAANDGSNIIGTAIIDISGQVLTPPTISSVSSGDAQANLVWSSMSGSVSYSIYQRTAEGAYGNAVATVSGDVYSYQATDLVNGTTYYFVIKATYPGGISDASNEVIATPQVPAPGAPELQATATGDGYVQLAWNSVTGSTSYQIFMGTVSGTYNSPPVTVDSSVYSYDATGLSNGTTYYFVVKAVNPGGISQASSEVSGTPQAPVVIIAVTGITLDQSSLNMIVGNSGKLTATVLPANAANQAVTWSSSDANIASVDVDGKVIAVSLGTAVIKATTVDGGFTATTTVNVTTPSIIAVTGITLDQSSLSMRVGNSSKLTATVLPANAANQAVTWSSSDANIASVDVDGKVTAVSLGTAVITATTVDGGFTATTTVHVATQETTQSVDIPAVPAAPNHVITITPNQLSNSQNGITTIEVPAKTSEIRLPANMTELIKQNKLEIKSDALTLSFPTEVFNQLTNKLTAEELKGSTISLKLDLIANADAKSLINNNKLSSLSENKLIGDVYEFHLFMQTSDGKTIELSKFDKPIKIELKVPTSVNPKLAGIFYIANDGTLTYIGGKISDDVITAELNHFSKYAVLEVTKSFTDVPSSYWASNVIMELAAKQIVDGTSVTSFEPERNVSRAEFTALLVRALKLTEKAETAFTDVKSSDWYADAVSAAVKAGIVQGKLATLFDPNSPITREEMVTLLLRAYEYKYGKAANQASHAFADEDQVSAWAKGYVQTAAALHFIQGRAADKFEPKGISTRAEAAQILYNLLAAIKSL